MGQRVALYCRVSTADQSCARQERDLAAFAERSGYDVVGTFKETGSGVKLDRAERRKVMALAQAREVDAVLVTELSRWGASRAVRPILVDSLGCCGIRTAGGVGVLPGASDRRRWHGPTAAVRRSAGA